MAKDLIHSPNKCGGTYVKNLNSDNLPYLRCEACGHQVDDWVKWDSQWSKWHLDPSKWADKKNYPVCLLGHICSLYEKTYGFKFPLSLSANSLFRGTEMFVVSKLIRSFDGNASLAKDYVDWVFQIRIPKKKKKITKLTFLNVTEEITTFHHQRKKAQIVSRSTPLPVKMVSWLDKYAPNILQVVTLKDYGDLKTLLTLYKSGSVGSIPNMDAFISKLVERDIISEDLEILRWGN